MPVDSGRSFWRLSPSRQTIALAAALVYLCLPMYSAQAQVAPPAAPSPSADFDRELQAFKKKIAAAKEKVSAKISGDDVGAAPGVVQDPLMGAAANPLGPAATLPVKGMAPATAGALGGDDMQAQIDAEVEAQQRVIDRETFERAMKELLPMTPEQIRALYEKFEEGREAAETPIRRPEVKTQVQTLSLDPGQAPPTVRLAPGYVTTLSVLDSTGAPWPVQDISFAGDFEVTPPETGGNVVRITSNTAHGVGNMSVRLVDLITPVIFTLSTDVDVVDYRFEAQIARTGPLAKASLIEAGGLGTVAGRDPNLSALLDGTVPAEAEKLLVRGVDPRTSAWRLEGKLYLRTPLSLLSPAWDSSVSSSDGTMVYTLNDAPVVLLSDQGRMVKARITTADEVTP